MTDAALSTLPRDAKGPIAPPPAIGGPIGRVAEAIAAWPGVLATTHWTLDHADVDGVDFYVGADELGHIHLDGSIHLATTPELSAEMVDAGLGVPFRWARGWTLASIAALGEDGAIHLFRRNYDQLTAGGAGF